MQSILTVTMPATDYDLTTLANVKAELNITNGASDTVLGRYISSASQAAMQYCSRVFAVESLSEQFLPGRSTPMIRSVVQPLQLSRWPLTAVASVTENTVLLAVGTDYLVDPASGQLSRISSNAGFDRPWHTLPLTILYSAGYAEIPADLEDAVIRMVTKRFSAKGRDPTLKQLNVPGVGEKSWWIATGADAGNLTPDIADILDNYRTPVIA